jgi:hypothetical protein
VAACGGSLLEELNDARVKVADYELSHAFTCRSLLPSIWRSSRARGKSPPGARCLAIGTLRRATLNQHGTPFLGVWRFWVWGVVPLLWWWRWS